MIGAALTNTLMFVLWCAAFAWAGVPDQFAIVACIAASLLGNLTGGVLRRVMISVGIWLAIMALLIPMLLTRDDEQAWSE